jgi:hypothetical protein
MDYFLVSKEQVRVEHFARQPDGTWTLHDNQGPDKELKVDSIGVAIRLQRIYRRVSIAPATN